MTILFANPSWFEYEGDRAVRGGIRAGSRWPFTRPQPYQPGFFRWGSYLPFPFFLASAAGWAKQALPDAKVIIRDSIARGETYEQFFRFLISEAPDCLVIEVGAASWPHDKELLRIIRQKLPNCRIAVAGPTASVVAKEGVPGVVDAFLQGEYEKNAVKFAQGASGLLPFDLLTREEMNTLPFPMFDEECALNYWDACPKGQIGPHLQLLTSRGCPFRCCFCAWPATMTGNDPNGDMPRSVRFHSPEWVEAFIRDFLKRHPETKCIYVDDDTGNLTDKHTLAISEVLGRIGLPWSMMCRADTSKPETWKAMKAAGCFGVKLGFESGSQRVIDEIVNKKLDLASAAEMAIWLRKEVGMTVHGTFTVGLPGETPAEQQQTHAFIADLYKRGGLDTHQISGTATIEGTPLDALAHGHALKAYPGAKTDGFVVNADGNKKVEAMR